MKRREVITLRAAQQTAWPLTVRGQASVRFHDRTAPTFGRIEPAAEFGSRATDPLAPRCALPTARQRMIAP